MPVNTDAILLGSWARLTQPKMILDVGTGTGILALMMAQREQNSEIIAIDIDRYAVDCAKHNVKHSPWADRIKVFQADVLDWKDETQFDFIICNPPYFPHGEQSSNQRRATARHSHSLPHNKLIEVIKHKLLNKGVAHFILPSVEARHFIQIANKKGLFCSKMTQVHTTKNKVASRVLFTLSFIKTHCEQDRLVIHEQSGYSQDFIRLTKDFYLNM